MQLDFKDFVPDGESRFLGMVQKYESPRDTLAEVNAWLTESGVEVIHVETLLIPSNVTATEDDDTKVVVNLDFLGATHFLQMIRVWFRAK